MKLTKLTKDHYLWQLFIDFHLGLVSDRERAKALLFPIHYGNNWDMSEAWDEIARRKVEYDTHTIR